MKDFIYNGKEYEIIASHSHKNLFRMVYFIKEKNTINAFTVSSEWMEDDIDGY